MVLFSYSIITWLPFNWNMVCSWEATPKEYKLYQSLTNDLSDDFEFCQILMVKLMEVFMYPRWKGDTPQRSNVKVRFLWCSRMCSCLIYYWPNDTQHHQFLLWSTCRTGTWSTAHYLCAASKHSTGYVHSNFEWSNYKLSQNSAANLDHE